MMGWWKKMPMHFVGAITEVAIHRANRQILMNRKVIACVSRPSARSNVPPGLQICSIFQYAGLLALKILVNFISAIAGSDA